jgi:hypothetical protein
VLVVFQGYANAQLKCIDANESDMPMLGEIDAFAENCINPNKGVQPEFILSGAYTIYERCFRMEPMHAKAARSEP